jgi:cytochrome P450
MLALMDRSTDWETLRSDRTLLPSAIEEMLRWASSTIYNRRTATQEIERYGQVIRPGDKVVLWWQSANFDERVFADPLTFDIRRRPNPHLSFGMGSHFCLGANLARLEMALVFDGLLDRVVRVEAAGQAERIRHQVEQACRLSTRSRPIPHRRRMTATILGPAPCPRSERHHQICVRGDVGAA